MRRIRTKQEQDWRHGVATNGEPLRFREKLGYGLGDTASNFFFLSASSRLETTPTARDASRTWATLSPYFGAIFTAVC